jgi:hypothetical protein
MIREHGGATHPGVFKSEHAAVSWRVPFLTMEHMPQMSDAQLMALLARNRAAVSGG